MHSASAFYVTPAALSRAFMITSLTIAANARAQHIGDVAVSTSGGIIATNAFTESGNIAERVFGTTFGDTGVARFTSNPGFDAIPGTFNTGSRVGFTPLAGLRRFTGTSVEPVSTERLQIKFLTLTSVIGIDPAPGFDLAVQSNGGWHRHFNFTLFAEGGKLPSSGLYVAEFELYANDGVTLPSLPFWVVYNDARSAAELAEAVAWVKANLVDDAQACPADFDRDGEVGAPDLSVILGAWGTADADLDGDGLTGAADLSAVLASWGACP
jgi:hypothetical protein